MSRKLFLHSIYIILIIIIGLFLGNKVSGQTNFALNTRVSTNELIVKFKANISDIEKEQVRKKFNIGLKSKLDKLRMQVIRVPNGDVENIMQRLKTDPTVEYVEPNFIAQKLSATNDPLLSQQWGLFKINAASNDILSAWDITTGDTSVKVAILDTGIEQSHPDLNGKVISNINFTNSSTVSDLDGHGTHVAGIVAAATNNANGVAGTGYNTALINTKVLDDNGSGYYSWVTNGIIWSADQGAKVITMSLGGSSYSQALLDAVNYAWNKGAVVVAAAGNNNNANPIYPGAYLNVIAVAAVDQNDTKAYFSNYGNWVDVSAPGVTIYSTYIGNSYAYLSGTSMATPFTSGTAALVWASGVCLDNACVRQRIEQTADKIAGTGSYWNSGRINAYNAVKGSIDIPAPTTPPAPEPTSAPTSTPTASPSNVMTVSDIALSYTNISARYSRITGVIKVIDETAFSPIYSATVKATITSPSGKIYSFSGKTASNGEVIFKLNTKEKGTFNLLLTNVTKASYTYHPTLTAKSIIIP